MGVEDGDAVRGRCGKLDGGGGDAGVVPRQRVEDEDGDFAGGFGVDAGGQGVEGVG